MTLKYVGPKVIISKNGVEFDNNKDDKYVYINIAIQLYKAFSHEYNDDEVYVYNTDAKRLNDSEIMKFISSSFPDYEEHIKKDKESADKYFEHEMQKVEKQKDILNSLEYEAWIKNIKLLKNYVLQRHFNKNIYYLLVGKVSECIKKHSIRQIHLPMYQNFMHVAHSIQGALKETPNPKQSKIDIHEKNGKMFVNLDIN